MCGFPQALLIEKCIGINEHLQIYSVGICEPMTYVRLYFPICFSCSLSSAQFHDYLKRDVFVETIKPMCSWVPRSKTMQNHAKTTSKTHFQTRNVRNRTKSLNLDMSRAVLDMSRAVHQDRKLRFRAKHSKNKQTLFLDSNVNFLRTKTTVD